jgi:hypothetical protein
MRSVQSSTKPSRLQPPSLRPAVLRPAVSLLVATLFFLCPAYIDAQSPSAGGFQTIASPHGYQFQLPAGWQEKDAEQLPFSVDAYYVSPDGRQNLATGAFHSPMPSVSRLPELTDAFLNGVARTQAAQGGSAPNVFQAAQSVTVANADAASEVLEIVLTASGESQVIGTRIAARGSDVVVFTLTVPEDAYTSDPAFRQILDSLALTP